MKWCLVLLILAGVSWADNTLNTSEYSIFACPKLKSQEEIDLDKVSATDTAVQPFCALDRRFGRVT